MTINKRARAFILFFAFLNIIFALVMLEPFLLTWTTIQQVFVIREPNSPTRGVNNVFLILELL